MFVVYLPNVSGFAVHNGSVEVFGSKYGESIKVHWLHSIHWPIDNSASRTLMSLTQRTLIINVVSTFSLLSCNNNNNNNTKRDFTLLWKGSIFRDHLHTAWSCPIKRHSFLGSANNRVSAWKTQNERKKDLTPPWLILPCVPVITRYSPKCTLSNKKGMPRVGWSRGHSTSAGHWTLDNNHSVPVTFRHSLMVGFAWLTC